MSNFSICGQVTANTGQIDCDVRRGTPLSLIVGSGSFLPEDYATSTGFKSKFLEKLKKANTAGDKLYPFPVIQGNNDKTVAAKEGNMGYGLRVILSRSKPGYEFEVLAGSSLEKKLMKFHNKILPVYVFDDASNVWGVMNGSGVFSGALYLVTVEPAGYGDGNNPTSTKISISIIDARDFTENSKFASTDFSTNDLVGLLDAVLFQTAVPATNVFHIGAKILTDAINSFVDVHANSIYASGLADSDNWVAKTGTNFGTTLAITSVTDDTVNGGWVVTFDSTAFTALATGAQIRLNLADPATLDAAGVTQIEGTYMVITKAA